MASVSAACSISAARERTRGWMIDPSTRSTSMFLAMTPPGSTDSSTVPSYGPPILEKYHQGIPFWAVTTTSSI